MYLREGYYLYLPQYRPELFLHAQRASQFIFRNRPVFNETEPTKAFVQYRRIYPINPYGLLQQGTTLKDDRL